MPEQSALRLAARASALSDHARVDQLNRASVRILQQDVVHQFVYRRWAGSQGRGKRNVHFGTDLLVLNKRHGA